MPPHRMLFKNFISSCSVLAKDTECHIKLMRVLVATMRANDSREASDAVDHQTVTRQCARLVKATHVNFASKRYSERLRTEHV